MFIQDVPSNRKFWVVRSDGGAYYNHFLANSLVAIGHLDNMDYSQSALINSEENQRLLIEYRRSLIENNEQPASASNKAGQVFRFINEMSIGDYIITLSSNRIVVGTITSQPYKSIDNVTILNDDGSTNETLMHYSLRRDVIWGRSQDRSELPLAINNSFRANQTVFSANEHWKELNHWMSVAFISDDDAYISSRIEQRDGINNLDIAQYAIIINKIEAIAESFVRNSTENMTNDDLIQLFNQTYRQLRTDRTFTVTTQQVFLSPGDLWAKISGGRQKSLVFVCAFLMLFGTPITFSNEDDENFISERRAAILTMLNEVKAEEDFEDVKDGLQLRIPRQKITEVSAQPISNQSDDYELDDFEGI
ncbi:hypothetical protein ACJ8VI_002803 [Providencia stuartii]|uniref:hypothetical protein n=2 Tax=Providencia stuartii TaxID=588 RepID=UPI001BCB7E6D|nr:hypothetical protein [Providencia thailandensis]MBS7785328.1 hypothetical protein [Providencia thailandensis]HEM6889569.1 hypothetical protein [Providencia rettgeri]